MAIKQDPVTYFNNQITKRGKSDKYGVYLTNLSLLFEATEDYGYTEVCRRSGLDDKFLVQIREDAILSQDVVRARFTSETTICGHTCGITFIAEDHDAYLLCMMPELNRENLPNVVFSLQSTLRYLAQFAGKTPTTVRVIIGVATMSWDDMVDQGYAAEVEVGW